MVSSMLKLIMLAALLLAVQARPSDDPDYAKAPEEASKDKAPYAKYDTIEVQLITRDNRTRQEWTSTFFPRVDEFSLLELAGTFERNYSFNPNMTITLRIPSSPLLVLTPKRVFSEGVFDEERETRSDPVVVTYWTVLVLLDKGNLTEIAWDDGCSDCSSNDCVDNSCGIKRMKGDTDRCLETNCNMKVYLAWMGRDKKDSACRSVSSMPSNFSKYSFQPVQNFGNGLFDDVIYKFTTNAPNPTSDRA